MFEPRAARQSLLKRELVLAFHQCLVKFLPVTLCQWPLRHWPLRVPEPCDIPRWRAPAHRSHYQAAQNSGMARRFPSVVERTSHADRSSRTNNAFFQFVIAFDDFIARFLRQRFKFLDIRLHSV